MEYYVYGVCSVVEEEKGKLEFLEKMEVLNVCEEVFKWLDFNVEVEKLEYESKLKMV